MNFLLPFIALSVFATGSAVTCDPPVLDTDEDWLVLVEHHDRETIASMLRTGWAPCCLPGADEYNAEAGHWTFTAWRKGRINLIVTDDQAIYLRSCGATLLAKHLNLLDKQDRVALFRAIKFEDHYNGVMP